MLHGKMHIMRDDSTSIPRVFNTSKRYQNEYQVAQQITNTDTYETRYGITIFVNGNEKLRSKRELIDKFIFSWLADSDGAEEEFQCSWVSRSGRCWGD